MSHNLRYATISELTAGYAAGRISPVEVMRDTLRLADGVGYELGAFITIDRERAMIEASAAQERIASQGEMAWRGRPLLGIPVSVKDLIATRDLCTTRGSRRLREWVPDHDAPAVARLRTAGAIVFGKTNTSECGWSASTVNQITQPAANPWDPGRSAGGSSGGAAVAVAAGIGVAAVGTDGAGSIRIPASFCGVVGVKPTVGLIPYLPLCQDRLSHAGPLTRTVHDAALLLDVMAGPDGADPGSAGLPPPRAAARLTAPGVLRIAWCPDFAGPVADDGVLACTQAAAAALADAGHAVEPVKLDFEDPYPALVTLLAAAEARALEPGAQPPDDPGRRWVAEYGRTVTAADAARAAEQRARLSAQLTEQMAGFDLLMMPTVPIEPFGRFQIQPGTNRTDEPGLSWLAWAPAAYPFNLTGQPAVSVPAGFTSNGMPAGLQFAARQGADYIALAAAAELERVLPWKQAYPRKDSQQ